jgi:PncC family amidohydrolase
LAPDVTADTHPNPEQRETVLLAADLLEALKRAGKRLVVAESCTGGLLGHLLTEVPGSSEVFAGGAITYDNQLKRQIGVDEGLLKNEGAVSAAVAEAMAKGIRDKTGAALAIAVTGIAGPGGGSETKPVGLTYVAVADENGVVSEEHIWGEGRSINKQLSAEAALRLALNRAREASG